MLLNNIDVEPRLFARFQKRVFSARICVGESVGPKRPTNAMEGLEGGPVSDTNRGFAAEAPELRFERESSAESNSAIGVRRSSEPEQVDRLVGSETWQTRCDRAMDSAMPTAFVERNRSRARRSWAYVASGSTGRSTSIRRTNSVCAILGSIRFIGGPRARPRRTKAFAVDYHVNCRESRQVSKFRGRSSPACSRRCGK